MSHVPDSRFFKDVLPDSVLKMKVVCSVLLNGIKQDYCCSRLGFRTLQIHEDCDLVVLTVNLKIGRNIQIKY